MTIRTEDGKEVLEDGEHLVVRMHMMDSMQHAVAGGGALSDAIGHRPGSLPVTDSDRQRRTAMVDAYEKTLTSRWRNPLTPASQSNPERLTGDARTDAYAQYNQRVANAWRH